jgi:3-deoxy-7-phosphoheptulonate synthase
MSFSMTKKIDSPFFLAQQHPASAQILHNVASSRRVIENILTHKDPRMLLIMGPCSFHEPAANLEYAHKLKNLSARFADKFYFVMRVFPEKPRTGLGWKGYISDPYLDGSNCMQQGIVNARKFMLEMCNLNIPIATEILNPITYLYYQELLSWATIGARTVESQVHRELASNLSMPVGFKNNTAGNIDIAINAIQIANKPQSYLGTNHQGLIDLINSKGNAYAHLVLRGGNNRPNYTPEYIAAAQQGLSKINSANQIIVDCSHGNSGNDYTKQSLVFNNILQQRLDGCDAIVGAMLESFLESGNQAIPANKSHLKHGCSITDGCLSWGQTKELISNAYKLLEQHTMLSYI